MNKDAALTQTRSVFGRLCAGALALLLLSLPAEAEKRVAFVVGNSAYHSVPALANATNDAAATRKVLEEAGFEVVAATDADLAELRAKLDIFAKKVEEAGSGAAATVFYAGHAVQLNGVNYLLPVDVKLEKDADLPARALPLSDVLKRLDATRATTKIVILDACRDNPFASAGRARGLALTLLDGADDGRSEAGLARVESKGGTLVAFSTSPGATAADGVGDHSPFTAAFLKLVREPGQPVEQLFRRVRLAVHESTMGQQTPWETSSLTAQFSFFEKSASSDEPSPVDPEATASLPRQLPDQPTRGAFEGRSAREAYDIAVAWDLPEAYRLYLELYPDDFYALHVHRALSQRQEEIAWAEAVRAGDAEALRMFTRLYPNSHHAAEARTLAATAPSRIRTAAVCLPSAPIRPIAPPPAAPRQRKAKAEPPPPRVKSATPAKPVPASRRRPVVVEEVIEDIPPPRRMVRPRPNDVPEREPDIDPGAAVAIGVIGGAMLGGGMRGPRYPGGMGPRYPGGEGPRPMPNRPSMGYPPPGSSLR